MTSDGFVQPARRSALRWLLTAPFRSATWRWVGFCLLGFAVGVVAAGGAFAGLLVSALLAITVIGIPALLVVMALTRSFARVERVRLRLVGMHVAEPYRRPVRDGSWLQRLDLWRRDRATWRDAAWLLLAGPVGIVSGAAIMVAGLAGVAALTVPAWYRWLPDHRAVLESTPAAQRFVIDSFSSAVPYALCGILLVWIGAWLAVGLGRAQAALMRTLLSASSRARLANVQASQQAAVASKQNLIDRVVRDLHDGAQARLVAVSLDLNLARQASDPAAKDQLLLQAQDNSRAALNELRSLVRGIEPPLLRERGLVAAVVALAREAPQLVTVTNGVTTAIPTTVASAAYFVIAEALTNVAKHSAAKGATVTIRTDRTRLVAVVCDDGRGGANPGGHGLRGLAERARAAGGTLVITSPVGGPTCIELDVPCAS